MSEKSDSQAGPFVSTAGYKIPGVPEDSAGAKRRAARASKRTAEIHVADQPEWLRLVDALRRGVRASVELDADAAALSKLAEQTEALADELEAKASGKRFGLVEEGWRGEGVDMDYLVFSPIMGRLNAASYDLRVHREDEHAVGTVTFDETAEGAVGLVHGGAISGIWDEVLAAANAIHQTGGPTGSLTVRYRKPTPLHEPLEYRAWVERIDERKVIVKGECRIAGLEDVLSEAEGIFIRLKLPGIDWHQQDQERGG